eukprot:PhM_4_TR11311/c0_g1_i1/m.99432
MEDIEGQFDSFWTQWETRKRKKLSELRSTCSTLARNDIEAISSRMSIACSDKKMELSAKVSEARQMQQDLWEGFQAWCNEVTTLVEAAKRDSNNLKENSRKAAARIKRSRDEMERKQQVELHQFQSTCAAILTKTAKAVEHTYAARPSK